MENLIMGATTQIEKATLTMNISSLKSEMKELENTLEAIALILNKLDSDNFYVLDNNKQPAQPEETEFTTLLDETGSVLDRLTLARIKADKINHRLYSSL